MFVRVFVVKILLKNSKIFLANPVKWGARGCEESGMNGWLNNNNNIPMITSGTEQMLELWAFPFLFFSLFFFFFATAILPFSHIKLHNSLCFFIFLTSCFFEKIREISFSPCLYWGDARGKRVDKVYIWEIILGISDTYQKADSETLLAHEPQAIGK